MTTKQQQSREATSASQGNASTALALPSNQALAGHSNQRRPEPDPEPLASQVADRAAEQSRSLAQRVGGLVRRAPLATQVLGLEALLAYVTHPHMSVIRGGLAVALAATLYDHFKRRPAKQEGGDQ